MGTLPGENEMLGGSRTHVSENGGCDRPRLRTLLAPRAVLCAVLQARAANLLSAARAPGAGLGKGLCWNRILFFLFI